MTCNGGGGAGGGGPKKSGGKSDTMSMPVYYRKTDMLDYFMAKTPKDEVKILNTIAKPKTTSKESASQLKKQAQEIVNKNPSIKTKQQGKKSMTNVDAGYPYLKAKDEKLMAKVTYERKKLMQQPEQRKNLEKSYTRTLDKLKSLAEIIHYPGTSKANREKAQKQWDIEAKRFTNIQKNKPDWNGK